MAVLQFFSDEDVKAVLASLLCVHGMTRSSIDQPLNEGHKINPHRAFKLTRKTTSLVRVFYLSILKL